MVARIQWILVLAALNTSASGVGGGGGGAERIGYAERKGSHVHAFMIRSWDVCTVKGRDRGPDQGWGAIRAGSFPITSLSVTHLVALTCAMTGIAARARAAAVVQVPKDALEYQVRSPRPSRLPLSSLSLCLLYRQHPEGPAGPSPRFTDLGRGVPIATARHHALSCSR